MPPAPDGPIRVALVHDVRVVHAGLRQLTGPYSDRVLVLPQCGPAAAVHADVVLHGDLRPAVFQRLTATALEAVFSYRSSPDALRDAVRRGAAGFVSKDWTARQLVTAFEAAIEGRRGDGPQHANGRTIVPIEPETGPEVALSPRECELLQLVAQGLTNDDIADLMSISVNSVKSYVRSAYRKIGVSRRTQAVLWVLDHDLDELAAAPAAVR